MSDKTRVAQKRLENEKDFGLRPPTAKEREVSARVDRILSHALDRYHPEKVDPFWPEDGATMEWALPKHEICQEWDIWASVSETDVWDGAWSNAVGTDDRMLYGLLTNFDVRVLRAAHRRLFGFGTDKPSYTALILIGYALFSTEGMFCTFPHLYEESWSQLVDAANRRHQRELDRQKRAAESNKALAALIMEFGD